MVVLTRDSLLGCISVDHFFRAGSVQASGFHRSHQANRYHLTTVLQTRFRVLK
jgi:hypothetical protein